MALGRHRVRVEVQDDGAYLLVSWRVFGGDDFVRVKDSFRRQFPRSSGAEWLSADKCWVLPRWQRATLRSWLAYMFERDTWSWTGEEEPQEERQQRQEPPRTSPTSPLTQAYATLHLLPTAPPEVVQAAHRALVKLHHPDAGGDHAHAVAINQAITIIREYAPQDGTDRRAS